MRLRKRADGWIDVHAHFSPPRTPEQLRDGLKQLHAACFLAPTLENWSADAAIDQMNRHGIAMELLSLVPPNAKAVRVVNDFGAETVARHPSRFGLLVGLPTDDPDAALEEITRADRSLLPDGFAVICCYNGVHLGDRSLWPVWRELDRRGAGLFIHPNAMAPGNMGRPSALLEVAFETTRTLVDMLYAGFFRDFPRIKVVVAHCGAALPALSGRLLLLGTEPWVSNPLRITKDEIRSSLSRLYLDTAATGFASSLLPALTLVDKSHILYGGDSNAVCTSEHTYTENLAALLNSEHLTADEIGAIGRNALSVFPTIGARLAPAIAEDHDARHHHHVRQS